MTVWRAKIIARTLLAAPATALIGKYNVRSFVRDVILRKINYT